jgi:hypothetical protein
MRMVERYKKFTATSVTTCMIFAMLFLWLVYLYNYIMLQQGYFYIARTRTDFIAEIDFEIVEREKVQYFLYRNESDFASDADAERNFAIVPNVE